MTKCGGCKKVIAESYTDNKTPSRKKPIPKDKPISRRWPKA